MKKTDQTIHKICIRGIKRSLVKDAVFKTSSMYEVEGEYDSVFQKFGIKKYENELPVCSCYLQSNRWSLLTTQRLITCNNDNLTEANMDFAKVENYGDFKGYEEREYTLGHVNFDNGDSHEYFIEIGKASMVMVQGVKFRILIQPNSEEENNSLLKAWTRRDLRNK